MNRKTINILFVCTGNSCRSPMAEWILKDLLNRYGIENVSVGSAGMMTPQDRQSTNDAMMVMVERGIDISSHRSRTLTKRMVEEANLILVMEKVHRFFVEDMVPSAKEKVFLLKEYGSRGRAQDIQ
ncbi:hypothetical protein MUP95_06770, partial [bacterium]|nr:hypothetical protein [bacterium]